MEPSISPVLLCLYRGDVAGAHALAAGRALDVFEAAALGAVERLRELLAAAPAAASARAPDGFGALGLAAYFRQADAVDVLLAAGAPVDEPSANEMRVTPLHSAAASRQLEIARRLVAHGANVDARQRHGFTPLHSAAHNGDLALVELLCAHGADRQARSDDGKRALDLAREAGHEAVARWLAS